MSTGMVALLLYLFTRLGALSSVIGGMTFFTGVLLFSTASAAVIWFFAAHDGRASNVEWHMEKVRMLRRTVLRYFLPLWLVFGVLNLAIPSQKDMMLIVGGALGYEAVTAIVNDERIQETGGRAFELMEAYLDAQIAEQRARSAPLGQDQTTDSQ